MESGACSLYHVLGTRVYNIEKMQLCSSWKIEELSHWSGVLTVQILANYLCALRTLLGPWTCAACKREGEDSDSPFRRVYNLLRSKHKEMNNGNGAEVSKGPKHTNCMGAGEGKVTGKAAQWAVGPSGNENLFSFKKQAKWYPRSTKIQSYFLSSMRPLCSCMCVIVLLDFTYITQVQR